MCLARSFLNCMLEVLRQAHDCNKIKLNVEFHRALHWFQTCVSQYNSISMYGHKVPDFSVELDACLTWGTWGLGGCGKKLAYHIPITLGYRQFSIIHLEIVKFFIAILVFGKSCKDKKVLLKCDNEVVVMILRTGGARDPFLGASVHNVWYMAPLLDGHLQ